MARVFAHDAWQECQKQGVDDRYEMILFAAHRARQLSRGVKSIREEDDMRGQANTVNALREFETGKIDLADLKDDLIKSMQQVKEPSVQEEE